MALWTHSDSLMALLTYSRALEELTVPSQGKDGQGDMRALR